MVVFLSLMVDTFWSFVGYWDMLFAVRVGRFGLRRFKALLVRDLWEGGMVERSSLNTRFYILAVGYLVLIGSY